eukprot:m.90738 g.90738  ORF g.90738 m.90738 type:complete len:82 (+) comp9877_c0_seq2:1305-1550(+)
MGMLAVPGASVAHRPSEETWTGGSGGGGAPPSRSSFNKAWGSTTVLAWAWHAAHSALVHKSVKGVCVGGRMTMWEQYKQSD